MDKRPIGILDSGIGGISILNKVGKLLPHENYVYYADSINNPYGNKTKEQLIKMIDRIMLVFLRENVKLVIIACNTASTQVITYLRKQYQEFLFVAVEPAIKVAYDYHKEKNTLVMATPGTIRSERLMELDKKYHQKKRTLLACDGLAELIEKDDLEKIPIYLENLFKNIEKDSIEVVVLGCTHYPFIEKEITKALGHEVIFVDGSNGVAKRTKYLLEKNHIENTQNSEGRLSFLLTDSSKEKIITKYLNSI